MCKKLDDLFSKYISECFFFLPVWENKTKFNNHKNIPNSLRCLIVCSNGCGKTRFLFEDAPCSKFLDYDGLIIFTKWSFQPEYQLLSQGFNAGIQKEDIIGLFKLQNNYYNIEDIIQLFCNTQKCKIIQNSELVFSVIIQMI